MIHVIVDWNERKSDQTVMSVGTVKWYNPTKGFGFIMPEDGGQDVFVHVTELKRCGIEGLQDGSRVEYEVEPGREGRVSAKNVQLLG